MAKDLLVDESGDLVIDPTTHDLATVYDIDEVAQRIRATLLIRYGEMVNLDPNQGADYTNFLGKNFNPNLAKADMISAIEANVPEVESVNEINFVKLPKRQLEITFKATARLDNNRMDTAEGVITVGN